MASSRIEELPDDFEEKAKIQETSAPTPTPAPAPAPAPTSAPAPAKDVTSSFEAMLAAAGAAFPPKPSNSNSNTTSPSAPGPALPSHMATAKQYSADEVLTLMNKTPLFMTTLDETDEHGATNQALEAIKALAYEGTRAENAENFRAQGNEMARARRWGDAREFYDKALGALRLPQKVLGGAGAGAGAAEDGAEEGEAAEPELAVELEIDPAEEEKKERAIEEACYANRALCNLELKNYGACTRDCAAALRLNPLNVKAWYRSASACLALSKIPEAIDACKRGLDVDGTNIPLGQLGLKIAKRRQDLEAAARVREEREARRRKEAAALELALKGRNIPTRTTAEAPDMEDAKMALEDPLDASSTLRMPVTFLYPLHAQSDFIKSFAEDESVGQHLTYIMPLPWDEDEEYSPESVECYIETLSGGLVKAGKKMALLRILSSGKVEIVDGMLKVYVVPKTKVDKWIEEFKKRRPAQR